MYQRRPSAAKQTSISTTSRLGCILDRDLGKMGIDGPGSAWKTSLKISKATAQGQTSTGHVDQERIYLGT